MDKEYFKSRRSVRKFKAEPVSDAMITEMVELAAKAPTTGNMQLYSVVATTDAALRASLAEQHFNQPAATGAPLLLTVCADFDRFERWCRQNNATPGFENWQGLLYGLLDASVFAQQLATVAEMMGLGTCFLGTTTFNAPAIAELLRLPRRVFPLITLAAGYPDEEGTPTERILTRGILHRDTYSQFSDEDIHEIYAPKDEFPLNKEYVAQNAKENLAQVFTDIRYPEAMNSQFSKAWEEFLKK